MNKQCVINYDLIRKRLKELDVNLKYSCAVHGVSYFSITKSLYEERNINIKALLFLADICQVQIQDLILK